MKDSFSQASLRALPSKIIDVHKDGAGPLNVTGGKGGRGIFQSWRRWEDEGSVIYIKWQGSFRIVLNMNNYQVQGVLVNSLSL